MGLPFAACDNVHDHRIDPFAVRGSEDRETIPRDFIRTEDTASYCIIQIMVQVSDPVGAPDAFRFSGGGLGFAGVGKDSLADFLCQVQPGAPVFQDASLCDF